uniref:Anaphase-promoting complex subunit 5 n=1 Tax=Parascaris univalens TaxID=6257 RepID=A0A915B7W3_PARUN
MMDESVARFDWDDAFCFVFGHSICEPITPYRLCIYLLIRCLDAEHRQHAFTSKQLADLSSLIYSLMLTVNLSFTETCRVIEKALERINPNLYKNFLKKVDQYRGDMEILIRRDELLQPPRRCDRSERAHPLVTSKSLLGVFIRRLAVTRCLQSVFEMQRSHKQWSDWLSDERPSTNCDIVADYANDFSQKARFSLTARSNPFAASGEVVHLTPLIEDVHLSAVKRRNKENQPSSEPSDVVMSTVCAISHGESTVNHPADVFVCRHVPTACSRRKVMMNGVELQPQLEELQSSIRARAFIIRQLHQLQMSPEEAMPSEQLIAACAFIKSSYPHLSLVHLLEMLNGVRCRNALAAEHALRAFFDWATMHINEYQSNSSTITSIDMRPLRYAPLLHARLARLFDQREHARNLLIEAMQQAQANRDLICLRLAIVEQAAIDSLATPQPTTPKTLKKPNNSKQASNGADLLTSVYKISPLMLMSMWASESLIDDEAEATDGEERPDRHVDSGDMRAFIRKLKDCSTLLGCIEQAISCENAESVRAGLQSCIMADYGVGRECSTKMISEAARAVSCTVKLQNGFSADAASDASLLLYLNTGDTYCRRYDTETQRRVFPFLIY